MKSNATNNYQREGSKSNTHVGKKFENQCKYFLEKELHTAFEKDFKIKLGHSNQKEHSFDLGNSDKKILIECKSHTWTKTFNVPSAKITIWHSAMYYFYLAPDRYRKIFFVLKDFSKKYKKTLAEYYIEHHQHLIPLGVEIWEYDEKSKEACKIFSKKV